MIKKKACYKCRDELPLTDFSLDKSTLDGRQRRCRSCRSKHHKIYKANRDSEDFRANMREIKLRFRRKLRVEVLTSYCNGKTPRCACCGEREDQFLCIDHIDGGGNKHRAEIGTGGNRIYAWLRKNGFPPGFRVLCLNCNGAIGSYGRCPHSSVRPRSRVQPGCEDPGVRHRAISI